MVIVADVFRVWITITVVVVRRKLIVDTAIHDIRDHSGGEGIEEYLGRYRPKWCTK